MKDVEQVIRDALSAEDARWYDSIDEQTLPEQVIESFRGKSRWMVFLVFFFTLAFTLLAAFAVFRFFGAETTRDQIQWATTLIFCQTAVAMFKMWYWMELNKNAVTREMKRFELQLARLSERLRN